MELTVIDGVQKLTFDEKILKDVPFEGQSILGIQDTVYIAGTVFAKTEEAFAAVQKQALAENYADQTNRRSEDPDKDLSFLLKDINAAECGSCEGVISQRGILTHGHQCEHCNEPVYLEYTRDGGIMLQFMKDRKEIGRAPLAFRIFGYREHPDKPADLLLFADPLLENYGAPRHPNRGSNGLRPRVRNFDEARLILAEAKDLYKTEIVSDPMTGKDIKIIVIEDRTPGMSVKESLFETYDLCGQMFNHRDIKYYGGQKYDELDPLPIPDSFSLSRKYIDQPKHSLAEPDIHEIILHAAAQVSCTDFYRQDNSVPFDDIAYKRMTDFVENFVDADPQEWAIFLSHASQDGPGFIHNLAAWCAAMSDGHKREVRSEPNMFNAISGMGKLISGQPLSYAESIAMEEGAETPEAHKLAGLLQQEFDAKKQGESTAFRRRLENWVGTDEPPLDPRDENPKDFTSGPT